MQSHPTHLVLILQQQLISFCISGYLRSDSSHLRETPKTFHQAFIFIIYFMQQMIQTQKDFSAFYSEYYVE